MHITLVVMSVKRSESAEPSDGSSSGARASAAASGADEVLALAAARRADGPVQEGDIRSRMQQLTIRQQRFERHVAQQLEVDAAGLAAMDHLMSDGPSTPTELARQLEISTAAMTLVLDRLESAGHVRRGAHPSDRRKVVVTASDASVQQAHSQIVPLIDGVGEIVDSMAPEQRRIVERFLAQTIAVYDEAMAVPER